ncbi:SDR family oxidoreductase [Spongiibacter sp. KMU-166]|uniref:SDR family oxidoreductase n=1 Tax=Spongiibacter thalassae TaxID=2721624 RepID=A0ABX1G9M5_9GAMM|nr:SDR family oxidoreductase [Spongiibacter thalassae]NKI15860.1 SDR family oxidoreductase [Spongiibacter thalassae]
MAKSFHGQLFSNKVAFVAGGTRGINLGIAKAFAENGANVVVIGRNAERAARAQQEISDIGGGQALGLSCDVRDYDAVAAALKTTAEKFGTIDMLVSGAAGNFFAPLVGLSPNGFKTVIDIDLIGTFNVFRASFDYLTKPGASLIAITAGQSEQAMPFQAHAAAAKAGVNMLTKTLAVEWGPAGVRANLIAPGGIEGTEGVKFLSSTPEELEAAVKRVPARRLGQINEIADMAVFLCSDASAYVSGQLIYVDGGTLTGDGSFGCLNPLPR